MIRNTFNQKIAEVPHGSSGELNRWRLEHTEVISPTLCCCAGLVGRCPILKPGNICEYYSISTLDTPGGVMHGSFQLVQLGSSDRLQGQFDALIRPVKFIVPPGADEEAV